MSVKIAERLQRVRSYGERRIPLGPGVVWIANPDLGTGLCFPITKLGYRVRLSGPAGAIESFLTFTNPTAEAQEATFLFPLDRNVAPAKIRGKVGTRQLEIEVGPAPVEEEELERRSQAPDELCHLFKEETEQVLAIPLGSVPAGGEVSFQILSAHMVDECGESGNGFSFRLPLMVSKALTSLDAGDMDSLVLAQGLDRGAQVAISLQIEASDLQPSQIATSQVCAIARNPNGDLAIEYDRRKPLENRDFVVDYQLWNGSSPKAWLRSQGRHFILNFLPPMNPTPSRPRRLVFLVDGSDEMGRAGAERCHACLSQILQGLSPEDRFALVAFNREVSGYKNGDFVEANLAPQALTWMKDYNFTGAADLKELLRRVLTLPRQSDSVLSVVLVAAGSIGNESELYRLLQGSRDILRLFPVLIGRKADAHFARAAARLTGGHALRALTLDSVSRAAERVLEHTRQPVLEGVGFQDKGLQYQGESLTPKYPSGLNWKRPITIMGTHSGRGGLEAGGNGPAGSWSEFLELKPGFHKVIANVWAQVKSWELEDEAQMLNRAERGILQNVIRNLSREFQLLNRYTAALVKSSDSPAVLAPSIEAKRWYKRLAKETVKGKSANELLEEQKSQKELKSGITKKKNPGRGLRMKETIGSKSTAAIVGSKLGYRNKLSGSVKEGLFSKPMLKSRGGGGGAVATAQKPMLNRRPPSVSPEAPTSRLQAPPPPSSPPVSPSPAEEPTRKLQLPPMDEPSPTMSMGPSSNGPGDFGQPAAPTAGMDIPAPTPAPSAGGLDIPMPGDPPAPAAPPSLDIPMPGAPPKLDVSLPAPSAAGSNPSQVGPPTISSVPPAIEIDDPFSEPAPQAKTLPTPKELARQVSAAARQGNPEETARNALKSSPQARQKLMSEMRTLHGTLAAGDASKVLELTDAVLFLLADVAPQAELLVRAYGIGYQARQMIESDLTEAKKKIKFWLGRFAKLF